MAELEDITDADLVYASRTPWCSLLPAFLSSLAAGVCCLWAAVRIGGLPGYSLAFAPIVSVLIVERRIRRFSQVEVGLGRLRLVLNSALSSAFTDVPLSQIESLSLSQDFFARRFDYGRVEVRTCRDGEAYSLVIANPRAFVEIVEVLKRAETGGRLGRVGSRPLHD